MTDAFQMWVSSLRTRLRADLDWLRAQTHLPIWVKGVLHPDDARQLRDWGAAGLVVSNHGGRTLDRAPASLGVLPSVRDAVGHAYPLLLDSGIRSGADVFQAIADSRCDALTIGAYSSCPPRNLLR